MHWEVLARLASAIVRRRGRFVVAELHGPHTVFSTSTKNGGQTDRVRYLINHQSCEGSGHEARAHAVTAGGQDAYHDEVCAEVDVPPDEAAVMGTAANMNYTALASEQDGDVIVTAVVTGGVQTNATCAGDPASWRETRDGVVKVPPIVGTINTMVLVDVPVTVSALTRTIVTMTEGKSAALQRLAVPSCASKDLATGTGTDQFCLAAPLSGDFPLTSASPHMKFGEIVGLAVRRATMEALRWQNGLEPSYTRGLFHALGRYGVKEASIFDDLGAHLEAEPLQLLRRNSKSAFYEPLVGAAAHAMAAVLDRARHETLPASVIPDAVVGQAATLAVALAAQPERWPEFRARLHEVGASDPRTLVLAAVALGWREKWRAN
ncbi:MAG: adenosylcobinamide amidohydrolase [Acidobacteriota bacterium]